MIRSPQERGQALCLLGFRASEPLLTELRLRLDQPERLRDCIYSCAAECQPAAFHAGHQMWFVHFDALNDAFWRKAPDHIGPDDIAALTLWFERGQGHHTDDLATYIWVHAVLRTGGPGYDKSSMSEDEALLIDSFMADVWEAWNEGDYQDLCEQLRDAELNQAEEELEERFAINFFDDVLDPLHIFHVLRKGNILHEALDRHESELPIGSLSEVAAAFLAGRPDAGWRTQDRAAEIARIASDIRTIRGA